MNNRLPIFILGGLVALALILHIANPSPPKPPGPLGTMPTWSSNMRNGDMGPSAVNPSGTMWAGAWNQKTDSGKLRSAVWIIDFNENESRYYSLKDGSYISSLSWADDKTIRTLKVNTSDPSKVKKSELLYINAVDAKLNRTEALKTPITRIMDWPAGSDNFLADRSTGDNKIEMAIVSESGDTIGKAVPFEIPKDNDLYNIAAISTDSSQAIFSIRDYNAGSDVTYYLADTKTGTSKRVFSMQDLPGRIDNIWVSPAGVLIQCSENDEFKVYVYNAASGKVQSLKESNMDVAKNWPNAPKHLMFGTYNGGYDLNLTSGKTKKVFDLKKLNRREDYWRERVRDGQIYPREDGSFTSVSTISGMVDIRVVKKDGTKGQELLPR